MPDIDVFKTGDCTLYHGDWREVVVQYPEIQKEIGAVITDPPYGIGTVFSKSHQDSPILVPNANKPVYGDDKPFDPGPILEFARDRKKGGLLLLLPMVLFGANHYLQRLPSEGSLFCWDKSCGKGPATPFVDAEFAWSSRKNSRNIFRFLWRGAVRQGEYGPSRYKRQHPTEKPPELMIWSMDYARVGSDATVFDPYMGVSPVGVACIKTGRRYIGIEIERRYFDIACKRLENEYAKQAA